MRLVSTFPPSNMLHKGLSHALPHVTVICLWFPVWLISVKVIWTPDFMTSIDTFVVTVNIISYPWGEPLVFHYRHKTCPARCLLADIFQNAMNTNFLPYACPPCCCLFVYSSGANHNTLVSSLYCLQFSAKHICEAFIYCTNRTTGQPQCKFITSVISY